MNIEEIAREKNIVPYIISPRNDEYIGRLQAFAAAVIKAHEAKLIESVGEPHHVGDSEFESWYAQENVLNSSKQQLRNAYAAGMGEYCYTATQVAAAVARANAEVEQLRVQLAGCGVAAMQNTESSKSQRAVKGDYGYSESYADVCRAVDREIEHRERITELESERDMWKATAEAVVDVEKSQMRLRIESLESARMAYAREFPLNADGEPDGEPDVGNIHANIRAMKNALKVALEALESIVPCIEVHGDQYKPGNMWHTLSDKGADAIKQIKEVLHAE